MLYIIIEDSNSGYEFWEIVFKSFLKSDEYIIKSAAGNQSLIRLFKDTLDICRDLGDSILIVFDNIDDTSSFNPGNFVSYCKDCCEDKGVRFYFSDFYCFESIFLSYKEMLNMTANCKADIKKSIEYVNAAINQGIGYWESTDEVIDEFLDVNRISAKNREHFESELLSIATHSIGYGYFHIKKSSFYRGKCWLRKCNDIQVSMNPLVCEKDCGTKCNSKNKNKDTL